MILEMCQGELRKKMCWALHRLSYSRETKLRSRSYELVRKIHIQNIKANHPARLNPEAFAEARRDSAVEQWNGEGSDQRRKQHSSIRKKMLVDNVDEKKRLVAHCNAISKSGTTAMCQKWKEDVEWAKQEKQRRSIRMSGEKNPMFGNVPSQEIRKQLSESTSSLRWVNKDGKNFYIKSDLVEDYLRDGFIRGRLNYNGYNRKENR